ncbi:cytochrome c family protein [Pseudodesulfovibrio thermohalotolerans]|uniref:cytochrome c family protein n=1 Tax=Pseudodesulfovibrio thermohalotolerans TaxID=2880651 RepID=UPI002443683B|nr:cytochrome c family protein [Pseudodesulfovibrio thermohalotolerans]WFS63002.1 cytochrome c family protein [Pseudodesulfovibrio thermohalotolerans]
MLKRSVWIKGCCALSLAAFVVLAVMADAGRANSGRYVGSEACRECHDQEYDNFKKFAKKAHSGESVRIMMGDLTKEELAECYGCHMTGVGQPGGFVDFETTPGMAEAGCEVCHGPGYDHVESGGDPDFIKHDLSLDDCQVCHNPERVDAFDFKPLLHGGAH